MSCFGPRVYRKILTTAGRRMDPVLAGTIRDELLSATDDRELDDFSWGEL